MNHKIETAEDLYRYTINSTPSGKVRTILYNFYQLRKEFNLTDIRPKQEWLDEMNRLQDEAKRTRQMATLDLQLYEDIVSKNPDSIIDVHHLIVYAMAVSGRRFVEVTESDFWLEDARLMYKPRKSTEGRICEIKYILKITKNDFIDVIIRIKNQLNGYTYTYKSIRDYINRNILKEPPLNTTAHKFRAAYADYLAKRMNANQGQRNTIVKDLLCHTNVLSSDSYAAFELTPRQAEYKDGKCSICNIVLKNLKSYKGHLKSKIHETNINKLNVI